MVYVVTTSLFFDKIWSLNSLHSPTSSWPVSPTHKISSYPNYTVARRWGGPCGLLQHRQPHLRQCFRGHWALPRSTTPGRKLISLYNKKLLSHASVHHLKITVWVFHTPSLQLILKKLDLQQLQKLQWLTLSCQSQASKRKFLKIKNLANQDSIALLFGCCE